MPFITISNEKNLDQLLDKRFVGLSPVEAKRVREATLKANPHLEIGNLKPGTVVVLPQTKNPAVKLAASRDVEAPDAVLDLVEALKAYAPQLSSALEQARAELDQSAKLLKSAAFKKVLDGTSKEAARLVKELDGALNSKIEANGDTRTSLPTEIDVLLRDLLVLAKKLA